MQREFSQRYRNRIKKLVDELNLGHRLKYLSNYEWDQSRSKLPFAHVLLTPVRNTPRIMRSFHSRNQSTIRFALIGFILGVALTGAWGTHFQSKKKSSSKAQVKNQSKGQTQMSGGLVKFGEVYTLSDKMNFEILRAKYTVEPLVCYNSSSASHKSKLVVVDIAIKNAAPYENALGETITLVDDSGNLYETGSGCVALASSKGEEFSASLKPGQGLGQEGLKNPLQIVFEVPFSAKITKMMITKGRLGKNEQVVRYLMAGTDPAADSHNIIAPLPAEVADPSDKSGATALPSGVGKMNVWCPAGLFAYKFTGLTSTTDQISERLVPGEGHKYMIATVVIKRLGRRPESIGAAQSDDIAITDTDGEKNIRLRTMKASSYDAIREEQELALGEEVTVRFLFEVSKSATLKTLVLSGGTYPWTFDISK